MGNRWPARNRCGGTLGFRAHRPVMNALAVSPPNSAQEATRRFASARLSAHNRYADRAEYATNLN
jgi:hypothetical protein